MSPSPAELFEAGRLGIVDKAEARRLLSFGPTRGRAASALARSSRGRFTKAPRA